MMPLAYAELRDTSDRRKVMMNRREYLRRMGLGLAALAMPGCASIGNKATGKRPPNIVLIVSD